MGRKIDMTGGSFALAIIRFAFPLMLMSMLQIFFAACDDMLILGLFVGSQALAAVGATTYIVNLFINGFAGLAVGVNVVVAQAIGAKRDETASKAVHTAIASSLVLGLLLIAVGEGLGRFCLEALDTPTDIIDTSTMYDDVKKMTITAMCDIDNPFYGDTGAAAIFGPQKGADPEMVKVLDEKMKHLASLVSTELGIELQQIPGSGAAGGMGGGMKAFFGAALEMGIDVVLNTTGFEKLAEGADMIFTGEGKIDTQSLRGKVVIGVARRAKKIGIPVIAVVGDIGDDISAAYDEGVSGIFTINRVAVPYKEARPRAKSDMSLTIDNIMRFMNAIKA